MNYQIKWGAVLSYGAIAFNIISGLLYTPWMIRTVGDDQYALYTLALSVINLFLMDFGIGSAVTKYLSNYYAKGEYQQANRFISVVYRIFIVISAVIAVCLLVVYFSIDILYVKLTDSEIAVFKRLFIIVATFSVLTFPFTTFNGILMANEQFIGIKACNFAQKVLNVALIILCLLAGYGVLALVLVHSFSNVLFLIVKYIILRRKTRVKISVSVWESGIARGVVGFSAGITVISIAQRCMFNIMPSVIAAIIGSAEVTIFSLAVSLEGYFYSFADAINGMFMPRISRILAKDSAASQLQRLMKSVGRFHVGTLGLLYLGFVLLGRQFVGFWMGDGYDMVFWCALLLIFPSLIDTPQQVARTALLVKDVVWQQAWIYVIMAVVNLVLVFLLVPAFGIIGAAAAVCIAYLARTIGFNILYHKALDVDLGAFFSSLYLPWCLTALVTALAGGFLLPHIPGAGWLAFVSKAVVVAGIYCVFYFIICVTRAEKKAIMRKIKR